MRVNAITYTDDEEIEAITVTMSLREAAALHAVAGEFNGTAYGKLHLVGEESLFDALADVFARHYDSGSPPGAPRITLDSLNAP